MRGEAITPGDHTAPTFAQQAHGANLRKQRQWRGKGMRSFWIVLASLAMFSPSHLIAQEHAGIEDHGPLELESYYEIEWGHVGEFVRLYKKNHLPILEALKDRGIIQEIEIHYPIQHMAGPRKPSMLRKAEGWVCCGHTGTSRCIKSDNDGIACESR